MKKIVKKRQLLNKKLVLNILLVLFVFMSIGYSTLSTNLNILGNLNVKKYYEKTLYNVLLKETETGGLARKYTGEHHDSFIEEPSKDIYHWYSTSNTQNAQILDKNNVIFADQCWQMIRTTDTGGVKMVYNGEAEDGKCLNTRGNHVGYSKRETKSLSTTYYYGTSYTYDKTNNVFSLSGTITTGSINQGEYTCMDTSSTGTCETIYLVDSLSSGTTYYVLSLDGNSHYSQFGTLQFNYNYNSPADIGYMNNIRYTHNNRNIQTTTQRILVVEQLSTSYMYAHSMTYSGSTYVLDNPYQVYSTSDYYNLIGEYTFLHDQNMYYWTDPYYIADVTGEYAYLVPIGGGDFIEECNYNITYGDGYTDNGDGTFTITNPITTKRAYYYSDRNQFVNKYVCIESVNNTCNDIWYVKSTTNVAMEVLTSYKYGNGFTYDENTGSYTLSSDSVIIPYIGDSIGQASLSSHHYTCWNKTGTCTTLSYVYRVPNGNAYYINLTGGKNVETALNEMLSNNDVNQTDSTIKTGVDAWYKRYMTNYSSNIEDTIYCNDRSIKALNGWDPNGGNVTSNIQFNNIANQTDLSCINDTDKFSISNSKAKLDYSVGLLSLPEIRLFNRDNIFSTGKFYWINSPSYFYAGAVGRDMYDSGVINNRQVSWTEGVRPVISLKSDARYSTGTGSMADPYIVDMSGN